MLAYVFTVYLRGYISQLKLYFSFFFFFLLQLHKFDVKSRLSRFGVQEPQDFPLPKEEAEKLSTETFRLWAIAAGYGQACDLYRLVVIKVYNNILVNYNFE